MEEITWRSAGDDLYAVADGSGPPVVMYHGLMGTHLESRMLMAALADTYRLVTPDARGRGRSVCPHLDHHTWDQHAADFIGLIDHLGYDRVAIGGGSFGSGVSLAVATRYPERLSAVILHNSAFMGNEIGFLPEQDEAKKNYRGFELAEKAEKEGLEAAVNDFVAGVAGPFKENQRRKWLAHDGGSLVAIMRTFHTIGHPFDSLEQLRDLTLPVLVIPGQDALHNPKVSAAYMEHLPNATPSEVRMMAPDGEGGAPGAIDPERRAQLLQELQKGRNIEELMQELLAPIIGKVLEDTRAFLARHAVAAA